MAKKQRGHGADEFGRPGSGTTVGGMDGPMIGVGSAILVDALVEKESGVTPGPPLISVRTLVVVLAAMLLVGLTAFGVGAVLNRPEPVPVGRHEGLWLDYDPEEGIDVGNRFELMTEPSEDGEVTVWNAKTDSDTVYFVEGAQVTLAAFEAVLGGPDGVVVDVESSELGTIDRLDASMLGVTTESPRD